MNIELLTMFGFFILIAILLWIDRRNIEFNFGIIIKRWKKGLEFIDLLVKKWPKLINFLGYIAIVLGVIVGLATFIGLIYADVTLQKIFGLVLPTAGGYNYPGPVVGIPFWYWLIAIFIILFVHETMHGIFARVAKVPLKNYGILLFFILPIGAFIEPDMKRVQKMKSKEKLQFFAGGSFANFITALLFLGLTILFLGMSLIPSAKSYMFEPHGVVFNETVKGYTAYEANITGVITNINGIQIKTIEDLSNILNNTKPETEITISTSGSVKNITISNIPKKCIVFTNICTKSGEEKKIVTGDSNYTIKTSPREDGQKGSFIGISSATTYFEPKNWAVITSTLFGLICILNVSVGMANLLPWKPFDGGLIAEEIFTNKFKKKGKTIAKILTIVTLLLLLFNLFGINYR
jgi:membrane-associated protease RseP (regulator of RpoE activity)